MRLCIHGVSTTSTTRWLLDQANSQNLNLLTWAAFPMVFMISLAHDAFGKHSPGLPHELHDQPRSFFYFSLVTIIQKHKKKIIIIESWLIRKDIYNEPMKSFLSRDADSILCVYIYMYYNNNNFIFI